MKLTIGITELTPAWEIALEQIGVNFRLIDFKDELRDFPLIIKSSNKKQESIFSIQQYLNSGGAVLTEADTANKFLNIKTKRIHLKYIHTSESSIFNQANCCDLYYSTEAARGANELPNQNGENTVLAHKIEKGSIVVLPEGFTARLLVNKIIRKNFQSHLSGSFPNERVSKISKNEIIGIVRQSLEYLFNASGLPFIHTWFFPDGEKTIFNFRIDTDFGTEEEVTNLYRLIKENNIPATWFIEVKSKINWLKRFIGFENQELAFHCYRHKILKSRNENEKEIKKGIAELENIGAHVKGYAAPYGEWNVELGELIEQFGFVYSSEFGMAHDGLPFYPYLNSKFSTVLQVPIHPISINRLQHTGINKDELIKYFIFVIEKKLRNFKPLFFYTHPFEKNLDVIQSLFDEIGRRHVKLTSLIDYANWWGSRVNLSWSAEFKDGKILITTENIDHSFRLRIKKGPSENYLAPLREGIVDFGERIESNGTGNVKQDFSKQRKYSFKMFKQDLLFHYRKRKQ